MLILLKIEDVHHWQRYNLKKTKIKNSLKKICAKTCRPPWVAEIYLDGKRKFIKGHWDYRHINYQGTRNIIVSFFLKDNKYYEIFDPKINERYKCKIENGMIIRQ